MDNRRPSKAKLQSWMLGITTAFTVIACWEASSQLGIYNAKLLPPPSQVAAAFMRMLRSGIWVTDVEATLERYVVGLVIGIISGVLIGFATGRIKLAYDALAPLMNFFRSTPSVALVPLSIVLLGIGETGKYFVIAWEFSFPFGWPHTQACVM